MTTSIGQIFETSLHIPKVRDFNIIHITDLHICDCDTRDPDRIEYMSMRSALFADPTATAMRLAQRINDERPDIVAITGDLVDELTSSSLDRAEEFLRSLEADFVFCRGNHDWAQDGVLAEHDTHDARLESIVGQPLDWHVQRWNEINFVSMNNSHYQFTEVQLEKTREVLAENRPCLVFIHIPLQTNNLRVRAENRWGTPLLVDAEGVSLENRQQWRMEDDEVHPTTLRMSRMLRTHPDIQGIFCGHVHFAHEERHGTGPLQCVTMCAFDAGAYRRIAVTGG